MHGVAGLGLWRQPDAHSSNRPPAVAHHCWGAYSYSEYLSNQVPPFFLQAFASFAARPPPGSGALPVVEVARSRQRNITVASRQRDNRNDLTESPQPIPLASLQRRDCKHTQEFVADAESSASRALKFFAAAPLCRRPVRKQLRTPSACRRGGNAAAPHCWPAHPSRFGQRSRESRPPPDHRL